jgi:hypothetical protein
MNSPAAPSAAPPPIVPVEPAPSLHKTLRRLFLTLFLRGRSARGLHRKTAPKSVGQKMALALTFYVLIGGTALTFWNEPVFSLALYLHGFMFVFLGLFVASAAGEVLFNKEEADILSHRPISGGTLLWAKIRVVLEVSLWLGGAMSLVGLFVGTFGLNGNWLFPMVHATSIVLEAMFCAGFVVMVYQLCLGWFGRERLEGLMTAAQVLVAMMAVFAGQMPRFLISSHKTLTWNASTWWLAMLPPTWFAGFDDALAGSGARESWMLGALAVFATGLVVWLAFGKLAENYEAGLQSIGETVSRPRRRRAGRRWLDVLIDSPPMRWWLRDPVSRASFLLTAAYLARDRDIKLRIFPAMAPMLVMPVIFLTQRNGGADESGFFIAFATGFLVMIPMTALSLLQYSQQWQASDIFRAAPMFGPASLCHGARRAVLCFLTAPMIVLFALLVWLVYRDTSKCLLLLPSVIALPAFALIPNIGGKGVPLSLPTEEAKSANRGLLLVAGIFFAMLLGALTTAARSFGVFWWFVVVELIVVVLAYVAMRKSIAAARWPPME